MSYISIFKTTVQDENDLFKIKPILNGILGPSNWTIALDDEEKILRTLSADPCKELVTDILAYLGFACEELSYE